MKKKELFIVLMFLFACVCNAYAQDMEDEEVVSKCITTKEAGQLNTMLSSNTNIEVLKVIGPINKKDFKIMYQACCTGKLREIDLSEATIESNKVPDGAFTGVNGRTKLRKIVLPEGLIEIGNGAFNNTCLEDINFPSTLGYIGKYSFLNCMGLMDKELLLPSSLKEIGTFAFAECGIGKINFPENLEAIGELAFDKNHLEEVIFTNPSMNIREGGEIFRRNRITYVSYPEGTKRITGNMFSSNPTEGVILDIPTSVEEIDGNAFAFNCRSTPLHEGLREIGYNNLKWCRCENYVVFPSTLEVIGEGEFGNWEGIEKIYSLAKLPPVCKSTASCPPATQFMSTYYTSADKNMPVYVPKGSAELYRNAEGWNWFNNFIETDEFPTTGIDGVYNESEEDDDETLYDLNGRRINRPAPGQIYIKSGNKYIEPAK